MYGPVRGKDEMIRELSEGTGAGRGREKWK